MPAKPRWLTKIPQIVEELAALNVPVLDRVICQRIFGVRRRRAIELMKLFGGYESANVMLLDRLGVIEQLSRVAAGDEVAQEVRRKERLAARIEEASRYRSAAAVHIVVHRDAVNQALPNLPAGVCFSNGRLIVEYTTAEELLGHLFELGVAAANDFDAFRTTVEAAVPAERGAEENLTTAKPAEPTQP